MVKQPDWQLTETLLGPCQTFMMELFEKTVGSFPPLTVKDSSWMFDKIRNPPLAYIHPRTLLGVLAFSKASAHFSNFKILRKYEENTYLYIEVLDKIQRVSSVGLSIWYLGKSG